MKKDWVFEEFCVIVFADVIERLNVLRGRGMASMYSWSSKRSKFLSFFFFEVKLCFSMERLEILVV